MNLYSPTPAQRRTTRASVSMATVYSDVADAPRGGTDHSATTIRCACNDTLDRYDRDGYRVNHNYSQPRAIAAVKALLS